MLTTLPSLLARAEHGRYAVGAFNVYNLETIQAVVAAAEAERSPAILQTSEAAIAYAGMETLGALVHLFAKKTKIPLVFHLDHGKNEKLIMEAIKSGWYGSVMFDGSALPYKKNLKLTKKIVKAAHARGVAVEAEVGAIAGIEDFVSVKERDAHLTSPEQALEFAIETGCDALAVAIGTKHGAYKFNGDCQLDFERLAEIKKLVKTPLVLHGASGVPAAVKKTAMKFGAKIAEAKGVSDPAIKKAVKLGIRKINIDTDLRIALNAGVRQFLTEHPEDIDPRAFLASGKNEMTQVIRQKMRLFGSSKK
ncbi:MAG: Fructose-bisphosphate aldolase (Class II) [Candidatus Uhrbacteria bacterium GW2011_GWE2_45_35]|uniref:Fructose-bisphosphate aldolase (Class II) n=2 Tax=Candidatus Uhriibacteriota TaxID=1752732 RepID=A0A0G1LSL6_9BACT|nr:MAG: Fructose-bisphosphate aldolase (Class II) [Candidatus Uhrbacteria bacterium GW2011_GWF2_44_350]KKU08820.1 MAG: Fructose-bisphosphate aldolase (Class II) [Candidatus Uhrbacteria bacterium GW2011_GWE2_45_35]HBR80869.1 tagatose-bisphosphate aldolase [Candidatus Uhrbacteria bacterium]HCU32175.1 tagatose-bisphosphate aldolase [Candidatus Uhrbacteria bacterium]